jgi:hypothetical protein
MSSLSMLSISGSSAPAPTLEDVYSANQTAITIQSAPTSANLPPLAPVPYGNQRSMSFNDGPMSYGVGGNDTDSVYSGISAYSTPAPAPMSAPPLPPPSMPPPPPPTAPMYGQAPPVMDPSFGQPSPWGGSTGYCQPPPPPRQPLSTNPFDI